MARLKAWLLTKINGNKNLKAADETLLQANETLKGVAEMIYKMDDTMTQEEENLCQRANQLRRKSEVTFKTIDPTKHQTARRVHSSNAAIYDAGRPKLERLDNFEYLEDDDIKNSEKDFRRHQRSSRRKSSISLDENFLSHVTEESVLYT